MDCLCLLVTIMLLLEFRICHFLKMLIFFRLLLAAKIFLKIRTILFFLVLFFAIRIFGFFLCLSTVVIIVTRRFNLSRKSFPVKTIGRITCWPWGLRHSLSDFLSFDPLVLQKLIILEQLNYNFSPFSN